MITPGQWKEYRNTNSSIVAVRPEQGRRYCAYINRYTVSKMAIEIEYSKEFVRIKNPSRILDLMIQAITENKNHIVRDLRVKQVHDGRQLAPFNVALWWQLLDYEEIFPPQNWRSSFGMTFWKGTEGWEDCAQYCKYNIEAITELKENYRFYDTSDLKATFLGHDPNTNPEENKRIAMMNDYIIWIGQKIIFRKDKTEKKEIGPGEKSWIV